MGALRTDASCKASVLDDEGYSSTPCEDVREYTPEPGQLGRIRRPELPLQSNRCLQKLNPATGLDRTSLRSWQGNRVLRPDC